MKTIAVIERQMIWTLPVAHVPIIRPVFSNGCIKMNKKREFKVKLFCLLIYQTAFKSISNLACDYS